MTRPNGPAAAALCAALSTLAIASPARAEKPPGIPAAEAMDKVMWSADPIGGPFTLTDQWGATRTEADLLGKVALVYFGFTYCPDVCPFDLMAIGTALDRLGPAAAGVQPVFITLDPERDDAVMAEYLAAFHESFIGLTGDAAAIRETANAFSVYFQRIEGVGEGDYAIDHTAFTYIFDETGAYMGFLPPGTPADLILNVLRPLLDE